MSALLLDASVILAAFDRDDRHHVPARALLESAELTIATLDLARYEVANVAIRAWRMPSLAAPLLDAIERIAGDGGVVLSSGLLLTRAAELAERHGLSVYDATYVAAAGQGDRVLVSCDDRGLLSKSLALSPAVARETPVGPGA
jgi:predicted nucleic acid-binding protein